MEKRPIICLFVVAMASMIFIAQVEATIFTFEGWERDNRYVDFLTDGSGNGFGSRIDSVGPIFYEGGPVDHNVSFGQGNGWTPNVRATWSPANNPDSQWDTWVDWSDDDGSRGGVVQTDGSTPTDPLSVTLTPDTSRAVLINSFDLDEHRGSTDHDTVIDWSISDATGVLASGTWDDKNAVNDPLNLGGRTTIITGLTLADLTFGEAVILSIMQTSGSKYYTAMDNLNFDQIPGAVSNPVPADGQTVSEDWDSLSWTLPEPNEPTDTVYCDVYFGTDANSLLQIVSNQPIDSVLLSSIPISLDVYETYYWRVDCYIDDALYEGFVWTFNTNNNAPSVDAGPDIRCWLTDGTVTVSLDGFVEDDGLPDPPAEYWTLWDVTDVDDLDYLTIHTPDAEDTDVTITEIGTYILELQAGDGDLTSTDTVTIAVYSDACESAKADPEFELFFGDADEDCDVDIDDFAVFAGNWLACNRDDCL